MQALEAIKIASAVGKPLSQSLLLFDALAGRFTTMKLRAKVRPEYSLSWLPPCHCHLRARTVALLHTGGSCQSCLTHHRYAADAGLHCLR